MRIARLKRSQIPAWLRLRSALWPRIPAEEHERDMAEILSDEEFNAVFVSSDPRRGLTGFIEVSLRLTAEGCRSSPVGYIEGWFVVPQVRRRGIGRALLDRAEAWAVSRGCREMASDAEMENEIGRAAHRGAGYGEVERLAHYRKELPRRGESPRLISTPRPTRRPTRSGSAGTGGRRGRG